MVLDRYNPIIYQQKLFVCITENHKNMDGSFLDIFTLEPISPLAIKKINHGRNIICTKNTRY